MHDYFDILGVPRDAPAEEIRRASARRVERSHPDFDEPTGEEPILARRPGRQASLVELTDVAIDFVDMAAIADRMRAAFLSVPTLDR